MELTSNHNTYSLANLSRIIDTDWLTHRLETA